MLYDAAQYTHINSLICNRLFFHIYAHIQSENQYQKSHATTWFYTSSLVRCGTHFSCLYEIFNILYCLCIKQNHASFSRHSPHHNHITSHIQCETFSIHGGKERLSAHFLSFARDFLLNHACKSIHNTCRKLCTTVCLG